MIKGKKKEEAPRVYRILPEFNRECRNCSLSNNCALGGHSFGRTSEIELLIVAAYPAREELKKGYSLAPNKRRPKIDKPNAGRYLQYSILASFDGDKDFPDELKPFYNRIGFTNMIKCSPFNKTGDKINVSDKHIKTCKQTWLEKEIAEIGKYNPTCPILLCGSEAVKLLGPKTKVYANRRKQFTYNNTHPVIVTFNPVEVVRYTAYAITDSKTSSRGKLLVEEIKPEKPIIIGSPTWHWKQDVESIKKLVIANHKFRKHNDESDFKKLMNRYS